MKRMKTGMICCILLALVLLGGGYWSWAMTVDAEMGACSGGGKTHFYQTHQAELAASYAESRGLSADAVSLGEQYDTMEWSGRTMELTCRVAQADGSSNPILFLGEKVTPSQYVWSCVNR